jgi:peptidoglycan/xylan/chitin deacetylase (PgdA/CDA1 family)
MEASWQVMKSLIRQGMAEVLYLSSLRHVCHKGKVAILTYHRVVPPSELADHWIQPGMYVATDVFERHMQFLRDQFCVTSLQETVERWNNGDWDKKERYCVVTFDDGWLDNYRYAYPILRKFEIPATIFLPTDFIGTDEWFWPEKIAYCVKELTSSAEACRQAASILKKWTGIDEQETHLACTTESNRRNLVDQVIERCKDLGQKTISELIETLSHGLAIVLPHERCIVNWEEVARMAQDRISFGSHSSSHRILTQLPIEDVRAELDRSQQVLKSRSGNYVPVFCYPNGNTNVQIQELAKDCGYLAAVGVRPGLEGDRPERLFDLRRIGIHNDIASTVPLYSMRLCAPSIA